jgi:hypothetical protein
MLMGNTKRIGLISVALLLLVTFARGQMVRVPGMGPVGYIAGMEGGGSSNLEAIKTIYANTDSPTNVELTAQIRDVLEKVVAWQGTFQPPADATWLDQRQTFLDGCLDYFAAIYPAEWAKPELEALRREGVALIDAGCSDAVVVMFYGLILDEMGLGGEALPWLQQGYYDASDHYTPTLHLLRAMCAARMSGIHARLRDMRYADTCNMLTTQRLLSAFSNEAFGEDADQPAIYEIIQYYCLPNMSPVRWAYLNDQLRWCEYSSEWLCKMIAGGYYLSLQPGQSSINSVFDGRGGRVNYGYSNPNTMAARQYFMAAFTLRPEWPQAATGMIVISGGGDYYDWTPAAGWFAQAVESQVDYLPAYEALLRSHTNQSPWQRQNTAKEVTAMGKMWIASGPKDTIVPGMGIPAMLAGAQSKRSYDDYSNFYDNPVPGKPIKGVLSADNTSLDELCTSYTQTDTSEGLRQWGAPLIATVHYDRKDWAGLSEVAGAITEGSKEMVLLTDLLNHYRTTPDMAVGQALMETGTRGSMLTEARAAYKAKNYDGALDLLFQAGQQDDLASAERVYLNSALRLILRTRELRAGRWVNIMPTPEMVDWQPATGESWVDSKGRITIVSSDYAKGLYYLRPVGATFEVRGRAETVVRETDLGIGPALVSPDAYYPTGLMTSPYDGTVSLMRGSWDSTDEHNIAPAPAVDFQMTVWKQRIGFGINGKWLTTNSYAQYLNPSASNILTLQTTNCQSNVRFENLQLRQLTRAPIGARLFDDSQAPMPITAVQTGLVPGVGLPELIVPTSDMIRHRSRKPGQLTGYSARQLVEVALDGVTCDAFFNTPSLAPILAPLVLPDLPEEHIGADPNFTDLAALPGYLAGLRLRFVAKNDAPIKSMQPIYQTAFGHRTGGRNGAATGRSIDVYALPGYAVGGLTCADDREGAPISSIQLIFMRVNTDGSLDPTDSYRSAWYGANTGTREIRSEGRAVVGVVGQLDPSLTSLGLVFTDNADLTGMTLPEAPVGQPAIPAINFLPTQIVTLDGNTYLLLSAVTAEQADHQASLAGGVLLDPTTDTEKALVAMWARRWKSPVWVDPEDPVDAVINPEILTSLNIVARGIPGSVSYWPETQQYCATPDFALLPTIVKLPEDPRPVDQRQGVHQLGDRWYAMIPYAATFPQARAICEAMGGRLASVHDTETNTLLASMACDAGYLGLTFSDETGPTWVDGSDFDFDAFTSSQMRDITDGWACLMYGSDAGWRFFDNSEQTLWFYCQWDQQPPADIMTIAWETYLEELARPQTPDTPGSDDVLPTGPIEFNGHWYQAFYDPKTWTDAQAHCVELGGHLVFIDDQEENEFSLLFLDYVGYLWIGATDEVTEGTFLWADGSEITFTAWDTGEPNDYEGAEDHVDLHTSPQGTPVWNDWNGDTAARNFNGITGFPYLCEWDHDPTATLEEETPDQP